MYVYIINFINLCGLHFTKDTDILIVFILIFFNSFLRLFSVHLSWTTTTEELKRQTKIYDN